jgi:hypothetical protein
MTDTLKIGTVVRINETDPAIIGFVSGHRTIDGVLYHQVRAGVEEYDEPREELTEVSL